MTSTVLITGTNRGIGLEFVRQYAIDNWSVIATCRNPDKAADLQALARQYPNVTVYPLDIAELKQINALAEQLKDIPIDHLINNAGVYGKQGECFGDVNTNDMADVFAINTLGTLNVCQAFASHIENSTDKLIITISTKVGSIADNGSGRNYSYRASKAALNMVMKNIAIDARDRGIKVLILHPGWVQTDMGGPNALIDAQKSVSGMRQVIAEYGENAQAPFYTFDGQEVPW